MAKSATPLILAAGAGYLLMGGKKKKSKKSTSKPKCPPVVHFDSSIIPVEDALIGDESDPHAVISMPKVAYHEAVEGNRNLIDISQKVLAPFLPPTCVSSESIKIDFSLDGRKVILTAVEFFYLFALELLEDLQQAGFFNHDETQISVNEIRKWWVSNMGDAPLPKTTG